MKIIAKDKFKKEIQGKCNIFNLDLKFYHDISEAFVDYSNMIESFIKIYNEPQIILLQTDLLFDLFEFIKTISKKKIVEINEKTNFSSNLAIFIKVTISKCSLSHSIVPYYLKYFQVNRLQGYELSIKFIQIKPPRTRNNKNNGYIFRGIYELQT
jgi:hypothetical protein